MIVELFIPCFIDQFFPQTAFNTMKVLEKIGCGVNYNPEQTCCGQPAYNAGRFDDCKTVGEKFIKDFSNDRYVVSPSASCIGMVKNYYGDLFNNTFLHNQYKNLSKNSIEVTDFLVNVLKVTDLGASLNMKVTYHDSCAALRELNVKNEPRQLLSKVRGLEMLEMPECETCCGFGGTFSVKHPSIAASMAEQKIKNAESVGAEAIVSTDWSCLMHLKSLADKQKKNIQMLHVIDVLALGIE